MKTNRAASEKLKGLSDRTSLKRNSPTPRKKRTKTSRSNLPKPQKMLTESQMAVLKCIVLGTRGGISRSRSGMQDWVFSLYALTEIFLLMNGQKDIQNILNERRIKNMTELKRFLRQLAKSSTK